MRRTILFYLELVSLLLSYTAYRRKELRRIGLLLHGMHIH